MPGQLVPDNRILLYPVTRKWNEKEVTYLSEKTEGESWGYSFVGWHNTELTVGTAFDTSIRVLSSSHMLADSWVEFDVTEILKAQVENGKEYYGFVIAEGFVKEGDDISAQDYEYKDYDMEKSYNNLRTYYSSEAEEVDNRPRLTIDYETAIVNTAIAQQSGMQIQVSLDAIELHNFGSGTAFVRIYTPQGKEVLSPGALSPQKGMKFRTDVLAKGVYFLKVSSVNEQKVHQFIVK